MNKQEKEIILNTYRQIYYTHYVVKIDKSDTLREFKSLLKNLNLTKEMYITENNIMSEDLKHIVKHMYEMIFETFVKYNVYVNYDLQEIDLFFEELQYRMTEEEIRCHKKQIEYITENS